MHLLPSRLLRASLLMAVLLAAATASFAADAPQQDAAAAAAKDKDSDKDAADQDKPLREQSIYIPYEKLRKVFEKEGRGVFLPYEKYRELWQAAQARKTEAAAAKPPVGAVITEIDNEATAAKDVVRVQAKLKIDVLGEGWHEVPLRLSDAAITEATLDGKPARIVSDAGSGYKLLLENPDKKARTVEVVLHYAKAISKSPGQNSVSFEAPQAPVSRWKVRIPEPGVKVNLQPTIAAMEVENGEEAAQPEKKPEEKKAKPEEKDEKPDEKNEDKKIEAENKEETVLLGFVGAAPTVRIDWTPKAEGATGLEALATVQAVQQVSINEGVTRTRASLAYTISRAELRQLTVEVPADQKVTSVFDANVRQWSVETKGQVQQITVQLFEPAKQTQNLTVELEKYTDEALQGALQVPVIKALSVGRQQGVLVVQVAEGLRADVAKATDLLQVDAAELPASLARTGWAFAYRFASADYDLELKVEKVQPRIAVETLLEAELRPERITIDATAIYDVQRAGVFRLEFDVPADFEIRHVRGIAAQGAEAVQVDTHHREGEKNTRLVVNLSRKALGRVGLAIQLQRDLREPDLVTPSGKAASVAVPIPRPVPSGTDALERSSGRLIVAAPESLRVNPSKAEGLRTISFQEALEGMQQAQQQKAGDVRQVLAYAFAQEPAVLELAAERRKPDVEVRQLLFAQIKEGEVEYRATFFYNVQYSGIKSLRIDLPTALLGEIQNVTRTVREKPMEPQPKDVPQGYTAMSYTGESELLGKGRIELRWTTTLGQLDVGKSVTIDVPRLIPMGVDRASGQIVVAKAETIDVQDDAKKQQGLRPIDPQYDLMEGSSVPGAVMAYEFHDDWSLALVATRYQAQDIKHTSIDRAVLQMVVTRSEMVSVQALYRMRSAEQRLEIAMPAGANVDVLPRLNGQQVSLEKSTAQADRVFVPLTNLKQADRGNEAPFLLELRYTIPGDGGRLEYPAFPQDPAVQKVYLAAYLPEESAMIGESGPWSEEFSWERGEWGKWRPRPNLSEAQLLQWVVAEVPMTRGVEDFPTDGHMYLFSALRPVPPDEGALRLARISENWLHGLLFAALLLAGVLLLRAGVRTRLLTIGALAVALVLVGVFLPSLSWHLLNATLVAAVFVVLLLWLAAFLIWTLPRGMALTRSIASAAPPPASPSSPYVPADEPKPAEETKPVQPEAQPEVKDEKREEGGRDHA